MKTTTVEAIVTMSGSKCVYGGLVDEDIIRNAVDNEKWLELNRESIIQDFLMLAVLDTYNHIAKNLNGIITDAKAANN